MKQAYRKLIERLFWQYRGMAWRVAIYVPSTNGTSQINNGAYVRQALTQFSAWFGGASASAIRGAWLGDTGLVLENTVIVYAYTTSLNARTRANVLAYAEHIKQALHQEAVAVEIVKAQGGLFLL